MGEICSTRVIRVPSGCETSAPSVTTQLERGSAKLGLDLRDIGIGFTCSSLGRVEFLPADGVFRHKGPVSRNDGVGVRGRGACPVEASLDLRVTGPELGRIDAEQGLALADIRSFLIGSLLHDAGDAGPHFGNPDGLNTARKFDHIVDIRGGYRDGPHRNGLSLLRSFLRSASGSHEP